MPRQYQRNIQRSRLLEAPWIVRQQHNHPLRTANHSRDVACATSPESQPDELELPAFHRNRRPRIAQHVVAVRRQRRRHITVIVVISEDRVYPVRRSQARERLRARPDVAPVAPRHVVAAQHDHIGPLRHHQRDRVRDVSCGHHLTVMKVGNQSDTQPAERRRKPGDRNRRVDDLNLMTGVRKAVGAAANSRAYTACYQRVERRAPAHQHGIMIRDSMSDLFGDLQWRGLVYDATHGARDLLAAGNVTVYSGFDPTASSLHVGHLLPMMMLARLQRSGHSPIALVGGGTGLIGDPSGKSAERTLQSKEDVAAHVLGIRAQLERFLDFGAPSNPARLVDNGEWLTSMSAMEFLRDVGKYFTVNYLLAKESVKRRIESEDGISYTEFSYSLLQAYDFLVLHDRFGCRLQVGGSDQWGNIVGGTDLIRKLRGAQAHGIVMPLLCTPSGEKFGKTESGTVWLDAQLTSPFKFYQFWFNTDDREVMNYLKFFTFKSADEIGDLERETQEHPDRREAQRELARGVTAMVHSPNHVARAEKAAAVLFGGTLADASVDDILTVFDDAPSVSVTSASIESGVAAAELAVTAGLVASKGEATRLIKQGGLYVNDRRLSDERGKITMADAIERTVIVLRKGQRERRIVRIESA